MSILISPVSTPCKMAAAVGDQPNDIQQSVKEYYGNEIVLNRLG